MDHFIKYWRILRERAEKTFESFFLVLGFQYFQFFQKFANNKLSTNILISRIPQNFEKNSENYDTYCFYLLVTFFIIKHPLITYTLVDIQMICYHLNVLFSKSDVNLIKTTRVFEGLFDNVQVRLQIADISFLCCNSLHIPRHRLDQMVHCLEEYWPNLLLPRQQALGLDVGAGNRIRNFCLNSSFKCSMAFRYRLHVIP